MLKGFQVHGVRIMVGGQASFGAVQRLRVHVLCLLFRVKGLAGLGYTGFRQARFGAVQRLRVLSSDSSLG